MQNPITALVNGVVQFFTFMWVATGAAVRKPLSPGRWNYGEQIRRGPQDVRKAGKVAPTVFRNGLKNAADFFRIRGRGNDGPRK